MSEVDTILKRLKEHDKLRKDGRRIQLSKRNAALAVQIIKEQREEIAVLQDYSNYLKDQLGKSLQVIMEIKAK